jgi:hypothetical protein
VTGPQGTTPAGADGRHDNHTHHDTHHLVQAHPIRNRSTTMNLIHEELARAHTSARLGEARQRRRGHQLVLARRLSRRAELAHQQALLAIARSL